MKRLIAIISFSIIISNLIAQNNISYGPRAGISIIPVSKSEVTGRNFQLGVNGGGFFNYNINHWFSIRAELNYSLKRQLNEINDTTSLVDIIAPIIGIDSIPIALPDGINLSAYSNTQSRITMHCIELPVMGVLHFFRMDRQSFL